MGQWLLPQLQNDNADFILLQDGAAPRFHEDVSDYPQS